MDKYGRSEGETPVMEWLFDRGLEYQVAQIKIPIDDYFEALWRLRKNPLYRAMLDQYEQSGKLSDLLSGLRLVVCELELREVTE
jgi:hypothetical protein